MGTCFSRRVPGLIERPKPTSEMHDCRSLQIILKAQDIGVELSGSGHAEHLIWQNVLVPEDLASMPADFSGCL